MNRTAHTGAASRHRVAALVLVALGTLSAFLAIAALWVNRQALDTDNWTDTSSELLEDPAIRTALSGYLVDQLYANVDVAGEIRTALPQRAQPLAEPAAGALRNLAEDVADELLQRPRVQAVWEDANRAAHELFLKVIEGGGPLVSTGEGVVTLDLAAVLQRLAERTGVGGDLASKLPPDAAELTVLESDQLATAQDVVNVLQPLDVVMVVLTLVFFGAAIALARDHRRETVRAAGLGFAAAGALALLARSLGGDAVVSSLASTEAVRPAAESVWRIETSFLVEAATAAIGYGVVIVFAAWLAGPTRAAVASRRALAPYLREPRYAWGGVAAIVLLVLIWSPTPATRSVGPALLLIGLLALGVEALRRQTAREFPGATTPGLAAALRGAAGRVRSASASARASAAERRAAQRAGAAAPPAPDPLAQLERLADLHDRGALTDAEFDSEKREILA